MSERDFLTLDFFLFENIEKEKNVHKCLNVKFTIQIDATYLAVILHLVHDRRDAQTAWSWLPHIYEHSKLRLA